MSFVRFASVLPRFWRVTISALVVALVGAALVVVPATTAANAATKGGIGTDLLLEVRSNTSVAPIGGVNIVPDESGTVRIQVAPDGGCLDTWAKFPPGVILFPEQAVPNNCADVSEQRFYLVPASHTPSATADADGRWFYIVSPTGNKCLSSAGRGLFPDQNPPFSALKPCQDGDTGEQFRVANEEVSAGVPIQWQNILSLAIKYASNHCVDNLSSCRVSPDSGPQAGQQFRPDDPTVPTLGNLATVSVGCGTATGSSGTRVQNLTDNPITMALSTSLALTRSVSVAKSFTQTIAVEGSVGAKDIWGLKVTGTFSWNQQTIAVDTKTNTLTQTVTDTVNPGYWLMGTWSQQIYTLSGSWIFGLDTPAVVPGALKWSIPAESSYPVGVNGGDYGSYTAATSHNQKDCNSTPASVNTAGPVLTSDLTSCTNATPAPAGLTVGSTVFACPGSWTTGGKPTTDPNYLYQWYLTEGGLDGPHNIAGATGKSFTIQQSTLGKPGATLYLGVSVTEAGPSSRLEPKPILTPVPAGPLVAAPSAPRVYPTGFAGWEPDATVGAPYTAQLITSPGSSMSLSTSGQLDGLTVSPTGVLSGTPTAAGDFTFTETDTPGDGGDPQSQTFTVHVVLPQTVLSDQTALTGTVGTPFDADLVLSAPAGMTLGLTDGDLPPGLTLDAGTGDVTGTPTDAGSYSFTVASGSPADAPGTFTITVGDSPTTLSDATLPAAQVGVPYSAQTVSTLGSDALIGLIVPGADLQAPAADLTLSGSDGLRVSLASLVRSDAATSDPIPAPDLLGLSLNADTGELSGTPTYPGSVTITIADLNDPAAPTVTTVLTVAPAAGDSGSGSGSGAGQGSGAATPSHSTPKAAASGNLADTGSDVLLPTLLGLVLSAAGLALVMIRRRRSS